MDDTPLYYTWNYGSYIVVDCEENAASVDIPNNVNGYPVIKINGSAFKDCTNLESVTIPKTVTNILNNAFEGCTVLTSITIPESVTVIQQQTFYGCTSLTKITLHDKITDIGTDAFSNTGYYNDASNWDNGVLYIDNYLITASENVPEDCKIKEGTKLIAYYAFGGNDEIKKLTIPKAVEIICDKVFEYCTNLSDITILAENIAIGKNVFYQTAYYNNAENWTDGVLYVGKHLVAANSSVTGNLELQEGTLTVADSVFQNNTNITDVQFPSSLLRIGSDAFCRCTELTEVTIPECVKDLGGSTFYNCTKLTSATINSEAIGGSMFNSCTALTSVTFGNKVKTIGNYAFAFCSAIESITIPKSVVKIGAQAFRACSTLREISILNDNINIGDTAFARTALTSIDFLPKTLTSIGENWFSSCEGLTSLAIPERITSIGAGAFSSCSNLTDITLHNGITSIGSSAFSKCGFSSITLPVALTTISDELFMGCSKLTSVAVPHGVTTIGIAAFNNCSSLTSVYVPKSVTSIGSRVFWQEKVLSQINYGGTEEQWNAITIGSLNNLTDVTINYNCVPQTTTAVDGKTFTVTGTYIDGCTVILALYKADGTELVDYQTAEYSGEAAYFTTTATDYTSAKVMVWQDLEAIEPITEAEAVNLSNMSNE